MHLRNAEAIHQQELLKKWVSNRHHIELQIADYGDAPPIHLINMKHYIYEQIRECKKQIKRLKKTP